MVLVVRQDLGMGKGKAAAQVKSDSFQFQFTNQMRRFIFWSVNQAKDLSTSCNVRYW